MTYETFKAEMRGLLEQAFRYTPGQVGFALYSEKMADLAEQYPEHDERLENESLAGEVR